MLRSNRESSADRPLGVVLVRLWDAEYGKHGITDELLAHPSMTLDLRVHELEQLALEGSHVFGLEALTERRRSGKIGEHDGDHASLFVVGDIAGAAHARLERRSTGRAERRRGFLFGAAARARPPKRDAAGVTEATVR